MQRFTKHAWWWVLAIGSIACQPDYPNCKKDAHCHEGEFCVNNVCQQCRVDADCPSGKRCNAGACETLPGYCQQDADCAPGQVCTNNVCGPCTQDSQCEGDQRCVEGQCRKVECTVDDECPAGTYCIDYSCQVDPSREATDSGEGCTLQPVYFEFDSSSVTPEGRRVLEANFACLQKRTGTITLEGHCDSWGTTEYNMALGERRAKVVADLLKRMGLDPQRIRVVSKGEEEATGRTEEERAKDRRVDFE